MCESAFTASLLSPYNETHNLILSLQSINSAHNTLSRWIIAHLGFKISWKICTFVHARSPSCSVLTPCCWLHNFNISPRPDIKTNFDTDVILELLTSLPCRNRWNRVWIWNTNTARCIKLVFVERISSARNVNQAVCNNFNVESGQIETI